MLHISADALRITIGSDAATIITPIMAMILILWWRRPPR